MAAIFLGRRSSTTLANICRGWPKGHPATAAACYLCSAARFSTAFEHVQGNNAAAAESSHNRRGGSSSSIDNVNLISRSNINPVRQGVYEAKQEALDPHVEDTRTGSSTAQVVADNTKEGLRKATQVADTVGDTVKKTVDGAWKATKEANQKIKDNINIATNHHHHHHHHHNNINSFEDDNNNMQDPVVGVIHNFDGPIDMAEYRNIEDHLDFARAGDKDF